MCGVIVRVLVAAAAISLPFGGAQACTGDKILFEEKFEFADPTWGAQSNGFKIGDGKAILRAPQNSVQLQWNTAFVFDNADICITLLLTEQTSDPTNSSGGLMFWVTDNQNYFTLETSTNGYFRIARRSAGQWVANPIGWTTTDALKQGPNQPNKLRLRLEGQTVTVEINDKQVIKFRGQAPGRPSSIGLTSGSAPTSTDPWAFSDLKVTNIK